MENCKQQTGVPVKKLFALPHSANENNININIPNQSCSNDEKRLNSFVVEGQPLKLSVETSTDWPTVLATFFVGVRQWLCFCCKTKTINVGWKTLLR